MSYNLNNDINMMSRNGHCIKQVNNLKYLGSYIRSTERDIKIRIAQVWSSLWAPEQGGFGVATPPGKIMEGF